MPRQSKSEKLSSAVNAIASGKNALETSGTLRGKSKKQTKKSDSETIEFNEFDDKELNIKNLNFINKFY